MIYRDEANFPYKPNSCEVARSLSSARMSGDKRNLGINTSNQGVRLHHYSTAKACANITS